jgi:hypothetical protein
MSICLNQILVWYPVGSLPHRTCAPDLCKESFPMFDYQSRLATHASIFQLTSRLWIDLWPFRSKFCVSVIWFKRVSSLILEFGFHCKFLPRKGMSFWLRWKMKVCARCWKRSKVEPRIRKNWICCQLRALPKYSHYSQCSKVAQKCTRSKALRKTSRVRFSGTILDLFSKTQKSWWLWKPQRCSWRLKWQSAKRRVGQAHWCYFFLNPSRDSC